ncbi:Sirohydrochlorin cobaltochelatase [Streptomyces sp. YIM 130001]|uniref:sirohydrochlorin chelatase n=1 Tax=Streptomyces sp. YIM 130001 TaxID=2259644 RepID=UPI000E64FC27|nr:sirohydrochlorin chelatase [Streptomyces sp. YIM 130001]RII17256.1 Sirohydrochlorin cobaltochelatase [Streptomyces sp. YIM 130001]
MTDSNPGRTPSGHQSGRVLTAGPLHSSNSPGTAHGSLDSAAELLGRITTQLGAGLGRFSPDGPRRDDTPRHHGRAPTLVVVAHGSRDPRTPATVTRLLDLVRALRPGLPVRLGHIELNAPLLADTLAGLAAESDRPAVLVPLLLGRGHHVGHDLPEAAAACPLATRVAAPLGPHPLLVEALNDRLTEAGWPTAQDAGFRRRAGVVLAAAGSRDPDGLADTRSAARALAERLGVPVLAAHASAAGPSVRSAVRALASRGREQVAVASYFTAPGRFAAQSANAAPWVVGDPLGAHPAVGRVLLERYDCAAATLARTVARGVPAVGRA